MHRTRNIGIIAHIDAGKTTTTERMLYYSGYTRRIGEVDDGSTVTDFLPAERARGITIQSAAITFNWPKKPSQGEPPHLPKLVLDGKGPLSLLSHKINLIDTPGHADFTFEVRRSLRVLDGAVCILDGVAGVEAQTEQVWKQAGEWKIPRVAYVNKLDRDGAAFARTVKQIGSRLGGWPVVCQIPMREVSTGRFMGVGDVINLQALQYKEGGDGTEADLLTISDLELKMPDFAGELKRARVALVELLSNHDENMVESFFKANEDHLAVSPLEILSILRRLLISGNGRIIPIFAGASFRNIGVQPLLDAIVNLLPNPAECPDAEIKLGNINTSLRKLFEENTLASCQQADIGLGKKNNATPLSLKQSLEGCALAFKVVYDAKRGILVYFRVYSGSIRRNASLYNTNLHVSEKATNLFQMYASDAIPVQSIEMGQIGVIAGSKYTRTGDTLIAFRGGRATPPAPLNVLQLRPIQVPSPVFFASIEPSSLKEERDMLDKLRLLLREDPSLHVAQDEDTGQTLLSGMGELHLEIARDRLVNDLNAKATMGTIEIGYRETILQGSEQVTKLFDGDIGGKKGKAGCTAIVEPLDEGTVATTAPEVGANGYRLEQDGNVITVLAPSLDDKGRSRSSSEPGLPPHISLPEVQTVFVHGALAALSRGPVHSYPVRNIGLTLFLNPQEHLFNTESSPSALASAARSATIAAMKKASAKGGSVLMEPVMDVTISVEESRMGNVINDISSSRGGHIISLDDDVSNRQVEADEKPVIDVKKIYAPQDPFAPSSTGKDALDVIDRSRVIRAKVPLKEMVGYLKHLRSITGGRGTFVMCVDRFERMSGQREKQALAGL